MTAYNGYTKDDTTPLQVRDLDRRIEIEPGCTIRLPDDLLARYDASARFAIKYWFDGIELYPRDYGTLCTQQGGSIALSDHACAGLGENRFFTVSEQPDGVIALTNEDSQAWFWSPEWQRGEREVDANYAAGRYKTFDNIESFFADLDADLEE